MKKLFDLRFVIGAFFLVIGILLLIYGLALSSAQVNLWCGAIFSVFGAFMLMLAYRKPVE